MPYLNRALTLTALLWLGTAFSARAENVPWQYNWSAINSVILADAPGTGTITLTDEGLKTAKGSSDIVATNIRIMSEAAPDNPDVFTDKDYGLTLFLLDESSGESDVLEFGGRFNGTISSRSSNLDHEFVGDTTQAVVLGENLYEVTIGPYTPPGPPGSTNAGGVSSHAHVSVRPVEPVPEPSTLVLSCIALPLIGLVARRNRRSARSAGGSPVQKQ